MFAPSRMRWSFDIPTKEDSAAFLEDVKLINTSSCKLNMNEITFLECSREIETDCVQGMVIFKKRIYDQQAKDWFPSPVAVCRSYATDIYNRLDRSYNSSTMFRFGRRRGKFGKVWDHTRRVKLAHCKKTCMRRRRQNERFFNE